MNNNRGGKRGRPRDPKTDEAILQAAIELFSEHGAKGVTMQDIAKRAGVAATTLYRRWSSKERLLVDALAAVRTREEEPIGAYDAVTYDQLLSIMTELTPTVLGRSDLGKLVAQLIGSVRSTPELMEAYWNAHLLPRRRQFNRGLKRLQQQGFLPPHTDPEIVQDMLVGALLYRFLIQPGRTTQTMRRRYCERLLKQLGVTTRKNATRGARSAART